MLLFFIKFRYIAILVVNCVDILLIIIIQYFAIFLCLPLFHFCSALSFSAADNSRVSAVLVTVAELGPDGGERRRRGCGGGGLETRDQSSLWPRQGRTGNQQVKRQRYGQYGHQRISDQWQWPIIKVDNVNNQIMMNATPCEEIMPR